MKNRIIFVFYIVSLSFSGCKNDDVRPLNIEGKWELESSFGGWTGLKKYAPGNGTVIKFHKNTYQNYSNDTLVKSGTYEIIRAMSLMTQKEGNKIIFNDFSNTDYLSTFVDLTDGKLTFSFDAYDAGSTTYTRISK